MPLLDRRTALSAQRLVQAPQAFQSPTDPLTFPTMASVDGLAPATRTQPGDTAAAPQACHRRGGKRSGAWLGRQGVRTDTLALQAYRVASTAPRPLGGAWRGRPAPGAAGKSVRHVRHPAASGAGAGRSRGLTEGRVAASVAYRCQEVTCAACPVGVASSAGWPKRSVVSTCSQGRQRAPAPSGSSVQCVCERVCERASRPSAVDCHIPGAGCDARLGGGRHGKPGRRA